jgi:hypothetical protein
MYGFIFMVNEFSYMVILYVKNSCLKVLGSLAYFFGEI